MPYRILTGEPLPDAVRRIASEQAEAALADLRNPDDPVEAVHDARKRCKKARGLARLVRPGIGDAYRAANRAFRDAGRALSDLRDRQATAETFREVLATHTGLRGPAMDGVAEALDERAASVSASLGPDDPRLAEACGLIRDGLDTLTSADEPDVDDLTGGLAKTRGRAVNRMGDVLDSDGDPDAFHEWRKRVKYGWYHLRLLREASPALLRPLASAWHDLSDVLGDAHDLHVIASDLRADPGEFGDPDGVGQVARLLDGIRDGLESRAVRFGARLLAEPTDAFVDRIERMWTAWRRDGAEPAVGELAVVFPADQAG